MTDNGAATLVQLPETHMITRLIVGAVRHLTRPSRRQYELLEEQNLRLQAQAARETKRRVQCFNKLQDLRFAARLLVGESREVEDDLSDVSTTYIKALAALLPTDRMG